MDMRAEAINYASPTKAPSFDGPVATPDPSILDEIQRIHCEALELVMVATGRLVDLQARLLGKVNKPETTGLTLGRRFACEGQLGQNYHDACDLRDQLATLHREIDQLASI
jgi:hypothetical protein